MLSEPIARSLLEFERETDGMKKRFETTRLVNIGKINQHEIFVNIRGRRKERRHIVYHTRAYNLSSHYIKQFSIFTPALQLDTYAHRNKPLELKLRSTVPITRQIDISTSPWLRCVYDEYVGVAYTPRKINRNSGCNQALTMT